jgi:hypothetical protein
MKPKGILAAAALLVVIAALAIGADEKAKSAKPAAGGAMDQKAMMEAMAKYSTPGPEHKALEQFVGTWDTTAKMWMAPGTPPQETTGTAENKMALGGRFLEQHYEGKFMDQPFTGMGYTGYDLYKKQYVGNWMDSMGTSIMNSTGTADPSGKTMTFTGTMDDPMAKKTLPFKEVIKVVDNDHHVFEMWSPGPGGKMFKMMEITYTRKQP